MKVTSELVGDIHIVTVNGDLDVSNVHDYKGFVLPLLSSPVKMLIDLSGVPFVDSSGMGAMITSQRVAMASGGRVKLCCMSKQVRESFELIRLNQIFDIYATRAEALDAMSNASPK